MKRLRWAALLLAVPISFAFAGSAKAQVLVVTGKSIDTLVGEVEYLLNAIAPDEDTKQAAQQGLDMLKDPTLLAGVDRSKPFGVWATMPAEAGAAEPPSVIVALPVTDLKALLDNLQNFGVEVDDKPGVQGFSHRIGVPGSGVSLYAVEAAGYAYLSMVPQGADKLAALTPANWVPKREGLGDLSASIRMDQIPEQFKDMLLDQVEQQMVPEQAQKPGEDATAYAGRLAGMKLTQEAFTRLVRECKDINLDLSVNKAKEDLVLDLTTSGLSGTSMEKSLTALASRTSVFQPLASADAAMAGWASLPLSPELRASAGKAADDAFGKAVASEKNPASQVLLERAKAIVKEMLASDSLDTGMAVRKFATPAQDGKSVLVAGFKVPDAKKLEDFVRDMVKAQPPKPSEGEVTLDAGKAPDGTSLHRIKPVVKPEDAEGLKALGEPVVYLAFRKQHVLVAMGSSAEAAIVKVLGETAAPAPATAGANPMELRVSVDRLAQFSDAPPEVKLEAAKYFSGAKANKNQMNVSLGRAPENAVRLRLRLDVPALAFLSRLGATVQQNLNVPVGAGR